MNAGASSGVFPNCRRRRTAPAIVKTSPITVNPGDTKYVRMPTYGLETCVIASRVKRRRKANRLPRTMTSPVRHSQLRKIDRRDALFEFSSLFMAGVKDDQERLLE